MKTFKGNAKRTVIDIVGVTVREAFPTGNIEATWSCGRIVIKGV